MTQRTDRSRLKHLGRAALRGLVCNPVVSPALRTLTHGGLLPPAVWKRLPVNCTFRVHLPDGSFQYRAIANDSIGRTLYWRGLKSWESETLSVFVGLVRKATFFLDVGANTGVYSLLACACNPRLRAIAFEPVPRIHVRLRTNVQLNGWLDRCRTEHVAVCDRVGHTKFHVPYGDVPSSASLNPAGFRGYAGSLVDVPTTTIDSILESEGPVDLMKIDVEGFEDKVLAGMPHTLSTSKPTLIIECNPDGPYREVESILRAHDYQCAHLSSSGPQWVNQITPDGSLTHRNYLFVPPGAERVSGLSAG